MAGLSQHGCRQVRDDHLAGKDRHNHGHEMTLDGLPASLSGRLAESTVSGKDRIWLGDSGRAHGFSLMAAGSTSITSTST